MTIKQLAFQICAACKIPAHVTGFRYLVEAIEKSYYHREHLHGLTKTLYPEIAKSQNATPWAIERAIRGAIKYSGSPHTNGQFIKAAVYFIDYLSELDKEDAK